MSRDDQLSDLREEVAELRRRLRTVTDRQEILDCLHRYSRGLDRLDVESIRSAYHPDASDHHGVFRGSPEGFVEWVTNHLQEWDTSLHILDLNNLTIDGDEADAETYVLFTQRRADGGGLDFGGGRYLDHLERREEEWAISSRSVILDWTARAGTTDFPDIDDQPRPSRDRLDPSYRRPFQVSG